METEGTEGEQNFVAAVLLVEIKVNISLFGK